MLNKRTNVLFSEDEYDTLVRLSKKLKKTKGELVRQAVRKVYKVEDKKAKEIGRRKKAIKEIKKIASKADFSGLDFKELVEHGRRY